VFKCLRVVCRPGEDGSGEVRGGYEMDMDELEMEEVVDDEEERRRGESAIGRWGDMCDLIACAEVIRVT